ncbi:phosphoglycerate dehydrogenase [Tetragenococcus koreensis]|uniref:D-3-phosphoglycerate dehydrogenase n=1 Tax=Tetragenococcus koreensis TaxID=290335 RepID=A0AAN4UAZ6_9ENTE|nr:phosphoglycerate dehydrogenase [Tetragenococcus koreensis]MCF1586377.1 phosphoglycerate dehydrogenase [Tetragenococcus koreensis]MCF1615937.1 phosphoglycerate dehydrogenase [Tetragenococcus koreensis]MCF1620424.1 phosphoglycerate dehydrogenase [Tetragenococcus koreensis]MCF1625723.1 phosphoglycerate dehydrogenase [Tetragenococcus koreensis]MCF1630614.1 phosphoglycerate dehydrogenase [Tetragenococcus koreensis]
MTKYILSNRPFREEFVQKMKDIDSDYHFVLEDDLNSKEDWQKVEITIGWQKNWKENLLYEGTPLKWVQSISAGVDYLPLDLFEQYGIKLSNTSGIHAQSIADHLLAILFMQNRGIFSAIQNQQHAKWALADNYAVMQDRRILIVGTGKIGQRLASYLDFFAAQPIGINTNGRKIDHFKETYSLDKLDEQANTADVVINILPLTDNTYHLYNTEFFKNMKETATYINVGRGASVDTKDLYQALRAKEIAYAAIDVFEEEPLPADHPLWNLENILITPHISGFTPHFQKKFMAIFLTNFTSFAKNEQLAENEVSLTSGY